MSPKNVILWPFCQMKGWLANIWLVVSTVSIADLFPPWVVSTLIFIRDSLPRSLGFTSSLPRHITGVAVFTAAMVISSLGILTYVAIPYALFFGALALFRLWPAVNDRWPVDESSWPLWTVR
ncbi:hypothetical protein ACFQO4_20635 [Saliphagus sp. GCM10025334]